LIIFTTVTWIGCQSTISTDQKPTTQNATGTLSASKLEQDVGKIEQQQPIALGAYYYPWYGPNRHWQSGYRGTPVLGEYDSSDPDIIAQHITWANDFDIDFFALSWWGKDSFEDKVIHGPFLDVLDDSDFQFAVLYESAGLLSLHNGKIDLDNKVIRQQLVSDFAYLAETLFQHPNVLKINGQPVIFLYLTRTFVGDVKSALAEAEAVAVAQGSEKPFIVGDEVYWNYPNRDRISCFDGVTAHNMHTSVPDIAEGFTGDVARQYRLWEKIAVQQGTAFIPNILPGFDDTAVRPEANHPVIPRSVDLFANQLETAKELTSGENHIIMITSWNEWHEDTSIEPTEEEGTAYLEVLIENP